MQFIDLIFFAMVAVFLILRLRSVLGRRTGNERPPPGMMPEDAPREPGRRDGDNVIELPTRRVIPAKPIAESDHDADEPEPEAPLQAALRQVAAADRGFSPSGFMAGAGAAFEVIITAFAVGDKATLKPLLNGDVFANFASAIDARTEAGDVAECQLIGQPTVEIVDAEMRGRIAVVTVRFTSEQVNVVRNANGAVIDGDPDHIARVVDLWSFARDTRSRDPNWSLIETGSVE
ncbi:MAG: Tim44/TimA family putative adaptor protein [Alphaproteobacteria bacterium]